MPELPEVETIKEDLKDKIIGRRITGGWTDWPKMIKGIDQEQFFDEIKGLQFKDVRRRAKNLIFEFDNGLFLLIHLKMTGHFLVAPKESLKGNNWQSDDPLLKDRVNQFIHFVLYLDNDDVLAMSDMRKFGWVKLMTGSQAQEILDKYGPEPLEPAFTLKRFKEIIAKKKGPIKKILLDQEAIAGIGNIYADEILFKARVMPDRDSKELSDKEVEKIYKDIKGVLKHAVSLRGTSSSDYRDTSGRKGTYGDVRLVYRRTGEPCPVCGLPIERKKVASRSSHYCMSCQV